VNILQVYQVFNPNVASGAAKVAYNISRFLVKRGHKVVFYSSNMEDWLTRGISGDFIVNGVVIRKFKTLWPILSTKFKIYFTPQLGIVSGNEIKEFDVIHLHGYISFQCIVVSHYSRKYGVPYVLQAHGSLPRIGAWRILKWFYEIFFGRKLLKNAAKVIALNQVEAEQYRAMGVPEEKIAIIPNGIDLSEYAELPPKGVFKKKFNIPEDKRIILYLGRIHEIKGVDILIKAYASLAKKINFKDTLLVIAGPDDGYLSEAKALAHTLRVSDSVRFVGPLYGRDKLAAYVDSEFCVLPSRYETFPMALLEAYACAKPIVASNVGGLRELIVDGETGLLFEVGDFRQLAEKMLYLLDKGEKAAEIGGKARKLVEEKYSLDKVVDDLEELYMEVVLRRPS